MTEQTYTLHVAGLKRELNILPVNNKLSIAGFIMFSDVELTVAAATELLTKVPDFDLIITAESKGIPLAYEMARQSGKNYILARKSIKLYMKEPVEVQVKSITTSALQSLYISKEDMQALAGRRVLVVDDVVSTGHSMAALEQLVEAANGNICGRATVLAEGDAANRDDLIYLEKLPLFFTAK